MPSTLPQLFVSCRHDANRPEIHSLLSSGVLPSLVVLLVYFGLEEFYAEVEYRNSSS